MRLKIAVAALSLSVLIYSFLNRALVAAVMEHDIPPQSGRKLMGQEEIVFGTTGCASYKGRDYFLEPDRQNRWFFVRYYADLLESREDAALLRSIAGLRIADPEADDSALVGRLSSEGRSIYEVMANTDPGKTAGLVEKFPPQLRGFIRELDPAIQAGSIPGDFYIVHNKRDNVIHYTQSLELYDHFKERARTKLFLFDLPAHVEPEIPPFTPESFFEILIPNMFRFWQLTYMILGHRS